MALYHFHLEQIKRSKGQKAMAAAAYRAGEKLYCDYYGEVCDYSRKGGVVHTEILLPEHAPREYADRQTLWDAVENAERAKNAQLAHSFDIALQNEFSMEENIALARQFVMEQFVARGMIADLAVHMPDKDGGIENPHFHVMCPIRPLNPGGTWGIKQRKEYILDENGDRVLDDAGHYKTRAVPTTDWSSPERLEAWRAAWAELCNRKFEEKHLDTRIDHRSYARQGVDKIPTVHEGPAVNEMEKRGIATNKRALNNWIRKTARLFVGIKAILRELHEALAELKAERAKFEAENIATLLTRYYDQRNANAYSSKARGNNLKRMSEDFSYLQSKGIVTLDDLDEVVAGIGEDVMDRMNALRDQEDRMKELTDLIDCFEDYQKLKPILDEMNKIRFKKPKEKYKQEHAAELRRFYQCRRILDEQLDDNGKLPYPKWQKELAALKEAHDADYAAMKTTRDELFRIQRLQQNLKSALRQNERPRRETPER